MGISPTFVMVYLVAGMLLGLSGVFLGLYLKSRNPSDVRARRKLLRGCLWFITEVVILLLFRSGVIGEWAAFITSGVLLVTIEYSLVLAEKFLLKGEGRLEARWLKNRQGANWVQIRNKGMGRYIAEQAMTYCTVSLLLMLLLSLLRWEAFSLSWWIAVVPFATFCGVLAAWEKWKRGRF